MKAKDKFFLFRISPVKSYHRNSMILHGRKGETERKCLRIVYADMKKAVTKFRNCLIFKVDQPGLEPGTSRL